MATLNELGFPVEVQLEGDFEIVPGEGPIFVLSREDHLSSPGVSRAVLNAARLIDRSVVALVAVEEYFAGDVRELVRVAVTRGRNEKTLEEYSAGLFAEFGSGEAIADVVARLPAPQSFARHLLSIRPNAAVVCVEDKKLYDKGTEIAQDAARQFSDEPNQVARAEKQLAWRREKSLPLDIERDGIFLKDAEKALKKQGANGAVLLNAGGLHIARIEQQFRQEGRGFLLLTNGV